MDTYSVKVIANAKRNEIVEIDEAKKTMKVKIKAQPVSGKANKELLKFLSKHFKKKVEIVKGKKSKEKIVQLN